ncbi:MAG: hypothetical protein J7576_18805 [Siphonobacter aquaeclarae]|nr:hypothetical protein [Siphonobacter aquaeclarae]
MTGIFIILGVALAFAYVCLVIWAVSRVQSSHECKKCATSIHLERTGRPAFVKKLVPFLPEKYYRCRHCYTTFFLTASASRRETRRKVSS